jgi:hypothetical protein
VIACGKVYAGRIVGPIDEVYLGRIKPHARSLLAEPIRTYRASGRHPGI